MENHNHLSFSLVVALNVHVCPLTERQVEMLEFSTKTKWPLLLKAEVVLELSNGESYKLVSKYAKNIEFKLSSCEMDIDFRVISKKFLRTSYGDFQDQKMILQIHSGLRGFIEIDSKQYKLTGFFNDRIKDLNFYCAHKPFLFGNEFKGYFPEDFKIQGIILVSYIFLRCWLKD